MYCATSMDHSGLAFDQRFVSMTDDKLKSSVRATSLSHPVLQAYADLTYCTIAAVG